MHLSVFNVRGQQVATLVDKFQESGEYVAEFIPQSDCDGIYVYQLRLDGKEKNTKKMMIFK